MDKKLIKTGLIFVCLGVLLGAFAAHGLENNGVSAKRIDSFQTGVRYLFYQGFGLLILAALQDKFNFLFNTQFRQIFYGTILFSGSIFALILLPLLQVNINNYLGPITPIGGVLIFIGWFSLFVKYLRN